MENTGNTVASHDNHPFSPSSKIKEIWSEEDEKELQQMKWEKLDMTMTLLEMRINNLNKEVDVLVLETKVLVNQNRIIIKSLKK